MNTSESNRNRMEQYLAGEASVEEIESLQKALLSDQNTADSFAEAAWLDTLMQMSFANATAPSTSNFSADLTSLLSPTTLIDENPGLLNHAAKATFKAKASRFDNLPFAYLVASLVIVIGLLAASVVPVSQYEPVATHSLRNPTGKEIVGRVTAMFDCQWKKVAASSNSDRFPDQTSKQSRTPSLHAPVVLGDRFELASGLIEITYQSGAKVLLQGPVDYEVDSTVSGFLALGKLTARVESRHAGNQGNSADLHSNTPVPDTRPYPKRPNTESRHSEQSEESGGTVKILRFAQDDKSTFQTKPRPSSSSGPQHLFAIKTPTATVTDLGTEFGVEVGTDAATLACVFQGSVEMRAAGDSGSAAIVRANEVVCLKKDSPSIEAISSVEQRPKFVRTMPERTFKSLDLADIVAGGDGFSGRRSGVIDPTNGECPTSPPPPKLTGDGKYHRVAFQPLIDGVFIPTGEFGPMPIDSAGHTVLRFPKTDNFTCDYIRVGGALPPTSTVLNGIDYALSPHVCLGMHANKGITFDLQAIRNSLPGWKPARFVSIVGNTEGASLENKEVSADIWVFVDGKSRFQCRNINRNSGAIPVTVYLHDNDRFLTLATTDGGNGVGYDWIIYGDPHIDCAPAD